MPLPTALDADKVVVLATLAATVTVLPSVGLLQVTTSGSMVKLNARSVSCSYASVARMVKLYVMGLPAVRLAVPDSTPVLALSVLPAGKVPLCRL